MKKTLTFVAAILFASVSQAALVTWDWNAFIQDTDFNGVNGTVDFIFGVAPPDASAVPFDTFTQTDTGANAGAYFNNAYTEDSSTFNGKTVWMRFTANGRYIQNSFEVSGLVGGGNPSDSAAIQGWVYPSVGKMFTDFGDGGGLNMADQSGWTPVPEPTLMALLASGVAAVAAVGLRRRFRK